MSIYKTFTRLGSGADAAAAVRFLLQHNMIEHDEPTISACAVSDDMPITHRYLAEEYDYNNMSFLTTDDAGFAD